MSITTVLADPIPVEVIKADAWRGPTGHALAYAWIDLGADHDLIWRCCMSETGEWWDVRNLFIRGVGNITQQRKSIPQAHGAMVDAEEWRDPHGRIALLPIGTKFDGGPMAGYWTRVPEPKYMHTPRSPLDVD